MSENSITGKVHKILDERGGTSAKGNAWKTIEMVIECPNGNLDPKYVKIEFGLEPEKVDNAKKYLKEGTEATFHLDLEAREYKGKWYNDIRCWKFDLASRGQQPAVQAPTFNEPTIKAGGNDQPTTQQGVDTSSDLPF